MKQSIFIIFIIAGLCTTGCQKFLDVNKDPNNPTDVQEALLLSPIEQNISDNVQGGNASIIVQNFVQNIAPNQPNPGLWNYQSFNVDYDGDWYNFYVVCLNNLKILNEKAESKESWNYAAIAKILTAYTLGTATDFWGDIPYSKAFDRTNFLVAYDSQEEIYKTVQTLLSNAIADIDKNSSITPGTDDYFYNGDMAEWRKAAWSLKARYFIHLTKAPGYSATVQSDSALVALQNGMTENSDDLKFTYEGNTGSENIWNLTFSPVTTYVLNATLIDTLKARNDPRLPYIAKPAVNTGVYTGRKIGTPTAELEGYSYPNDFYGGAASSNYIFTYSEASFIRAEALYRTQGVTAAQPVYVNGINSNMAKLGIDTTSAAAIAYVNSRMLTAENALQLIMEEKAVANLFNFETYNDWRRTGYPVLTPVEGALSAIPRRLLYPQSEIITNAQSQQSAKLTDRVWWDAQ
ncbi:SusD/RagB family nutrient-binding outer membrane lipoprotein [Ilyomonas limi]|uniref:SusD/RagB family nutrient-binding outer membrane lipoprotein n=1 Tax=Ilyomonas limi TaxID=2575867 RepID=A0A4U3KW90_9BACT|nr:SusD/RagB family nutrient-binding outer membrane lipoprotein [Ilyomonas limi]TKK65307.1 SusD/RagB family nutrient-binding outer membrane lipoprotein [Ilyomonas limi]